MASLLLDRKSQSEQYLTKISTTVVLSHFIRHQKKPSLLLKSITMGVVQQYYMPVNLTGTTKRTWIQKFIDWCASQEKNRMLWLALIIAGHGCIITPITVMSIMLGGNNSMLLWAFAIGAMAMSLVSNLAAMPVKITLPVFLTSLVIDIAIVAICIAGLL